MEKSTELFQCIREKKHQNINHAYPKTIGTKGKNHSICILHHLIRITFYASKLFYPVFHNLDKYKKREGKIKIQS